MSGFAKESPKGGTRALVGAAVAIGGACSFAVIVLALQAISPHYNWQAQLISELESEPNGWLMLPGFLGLSLSTSGVAVALEGAPWSVRNALFAMSAALLGAGIFPLASYPAPHVGFVAIAFLLAVSAMVALPILAAERQRFFKTASWLLALTSSVGTLLGHVALPIGIGQRITAVSLVTWLVAAAVHALKTRPA